MNQSDIRGLAFQLEPTVIFFVASVAFYIPDLQITIRHHRRVLIRTQIPDQLGDSLLIRPRMELGLRELLIELKLQRLIGNGNTLCSGCFKTN